MKIAVLGYSGSGKSTLADILAERYALPCLHLDSVFWSAGWTEREHAEALRMVSDFLQKNNWVIDGNYRSLFQKERLADADQILLLQFPRFLCLYRAFKRFFQNRGTTAPRHGGGMCGKDRRGICLVDSIQGTKKGCAGALPQNTGAISR